jgi:hypothetical protein
MIAIGSLMKSTGTYQKNSNLRVNMPAENQRLCTEKNVYRTEKLQKSYEKADITQKKVQRVFFPFRIVGREEKSAFVDNPRGAYRTFVDSLRRVGNVRAARQKSVCKKIEIFTEQIAK